MRFSQPLLSWLDSSISGRLLRLAAIFLGLYALAFTLSPAVRDLDFGGLGELRYSHWLAVLVWLVVFFFLHRELRAHLPQHDRLLLPIAALLSGWGLLTVWRLTTLFGLRQSLWLAICAGIVIGMLRFKERILPALRRYKYLWLLAGFAITALTFFFGTNPSGIGPRLWLGCCGVYFQPSEPLKLLLVIYLAAYLADRQALIPRLLPLLAPTVVMSGMALLLLLIQRDLGTAWVFIFIYTTLIYAATGDRRILIASLASSVLALLLGYEFVGLVHLRIEGWLNPWADPSGSAYQIVQALLAVAAGGILGRGPGLGNPGFVPVSHTDFIYTSIVEESGLIGAVLLITLIALFTLRALRISLRAEDPYPRYLAVGLSGYIASQSLLIIGGNIRMLPLTGVTLPFVSYGGSSLLTSFIALLLLAMISNQKRRANYPPSHSRASLVLAGGFLAAFGAAALMTAWWGYVRGPDLLTRNDNARRALSDQIVPRGDLLDRDGEILNTTQGEPGQYTRAYLLPELSTVLGYSHPIYGQAGLEEGLDPTLRGEEHQPALAFWTRELLYGQAPDGLNVRLSLDADLQREAAEMLGGQSGAAVLLDAASGEILLMASLPGFDANQLDEQWEALTASQDSPLVNRAAQWPYPPGTLLAPFVYTEAVSAGIPLPRIGELTYSLEGTELSCQSDPGDTADWADVLAAGCPGPLAELGLALGDEALFDLYSELGLYSPPEIRMEVFHPTMRSGIDRPGLAAIGQRGLLVTPLQMALAASTLTNFGLLPAPRIALEVQQSDGEWLELDPVGEARQVLNNPISTSTAQALASDALPLWENSARANLDADRVVSWYVAGTLPGQTGRSLTVVILLEGNESTLAQAVGQRLILRALED